MKSAILVVVAALAFGACGSKKPTCEKLMRKIAECSLADQKRIGLDHTDVNKTGPISDEMIEATCKDERVVRETANQLSCADSACDALDACLRKAGSASH